MIKKTEKIGIKNQYLVFSYRMCILHNLFLKDLDKYKIAIKF